MPTSPSHHPSRASEPCISIRILENGPYEVTGEVRLRRRAIVPDGNAYRYQDGATLDHPTTMHLCRCGLSHHAPFCDGSHVGAFDGRETASRDLYDYRAKVLAGPRLYLQDDGRCAFARFCHQPLGTVWELAAQSDDEASYQQAVAGSCACPTGRLTAVDRQTGNQYEAESEPAIEPLADPQRECDGPLAVRGAVRLVGSDGTAYEQRNRMALCRCGHSSDKPFCDGAHAARGWQEAKASS